MIKPSILFIIGVLDSGGVSKSMLSLLSVIDKKRYDVSLLMMNDSGIFTNTIPKDIIVYRDVRLTALSSGIRGVRLLLAKGYFLLAMLHVVRLFITYFSRAYGGWWHSKIAPVITPNVEYDLIVDYAGQMQLYYMVDKLKAKKKVSFFHSDYRKWSYFEKTDRKYYKFVDKIFTISETCVAAMKDVFPEHASKIELMENITSIEQLTRMALQPIELPLTHGIVLISVGHVWKAKGIDFAIEAASDLKNNGIDFTWWMIGSIGTDEPWQRYVIDKGLDGNIQFLGVQNNPYPFVKRADIFVHLSRFEGKSIALDEAKLLCKPIVATNFSTVNDQLENKKNATICEMNGKAAYLAIRELIEDSDLRNQYVKHLRQHIQDNSNEVEKIYSLLKNDVK